VDFTLHQFWNSMGLCLEYRRGNCISCTSCVHCIYLRLQYTCV